MDAFGEIEAVHLLLDHGRTWSEGVDPSVWLELDTAQGSGCIRLTWEAQDERRPLIGCINPTFLSVFADRPPLVVHPLNGPRDYTLCLHCGSAPHDIRCLQSDQYRAHRIGVLPRGE